MWTSALLLSCLAASPTAPPQETDRRFADVEATVDASIDAGTIRGAVLLIGRGGETLHRSAHGESAPGTPMALDAVFDLASVTKPVATAASVMRLVERGALRLDEPARTHVPELTGEDAASITIEHLLVHTSGLAPANPLADFEGGPEAGFAAFCARDLRSAPGEAFAYSDLGFIVLGKIVERVSGRSLAAFAQDEVHVPLGMRDTTYGPLTGTLLERCVATEPGTDLGTVHDPRAAALGGVAGHAGLFGTGADVARFCSLLAGAVPDAPLSASTVAEMTRPRVLEGGRLARALGLDVATGYDAPRGALFPRYTSFGHTGFTGPCFWVDRASGAWYVLMLSRLQVAPAPSVSPLRRATADAVARALQLESVPVEPHVRCGIDVLAGEDCARLAGRKVGLITNTTGRARDGRRTIDVLAESSNVDLVRLFSPEHGLFAKLEGDVADALDVATGLPVFSLYGDTRKPTPEMLEGLDAVVFDIQDVGVRYYTYISTLGLAMEACAEAGVTVVVLDRPNPITGVRVEGPIVDEDRLSFIGWRPLPVTHGMTVGELARMFCREWRGIDVELEVVQMEGWVRSMWWEETGVRWINPSPNMRNPTQAVLYPCTGLLEGANLSVGRGTDEPFERFGAPWIDGPGLCDALRAANLPGVQFTPIEFTPDASKFKDEPCEGIEVTLTDRDAFRPVTTGLAILWTLDRLFGRAFEADEGDSRLMARDTYRRLLTADDWRTVPATWSDAVTAFRRMRAPYLIYGDER
ncbi:MAG: exo-beta-N-acetylmuramidase NamZ domain-containing protein [Planctomycetota bacterium]